MGNSTMARVTGNLVGREIFSTAMVQPVALALY
jgi:hypothetical protein